MPDEIRIDLDSPDALEAMARYAQSMAAIEDEYERAKADALTMLKRDLAAINLKVAPAIGERKEFTRQDIEDARKTYPAITPDTPIKWSWHPWPDGILTPPYKITCFSTTGFEG